jgi:hypothetical protein
LLTDLETIALRVDVVDGHSNERRPDQGPPLAVQIEFVGSATLLEQD